ncbi:3'(2'),5'-bisphosphate nucleotidase [Telmatospirillum siberiense]|uniref:3'(2'),5'-bisphosphate nucleotidase CysQ n=2 Tax=Telmatospirillum siberiense TaxID=382514 RepID=A0A2N3Q0R7_9PROT|nr:3'(2'),5'-bisphosphate nucleotidase CysQ [Telmatospirillum siberiense]PKU26259.1 3'(2'),5'-bisphosphate nucleotidase [Telmatospirillum siberiense]
MLPTIKSLAREAGKAILDVYGSDFAVTRKDDASPVTEADLRAEAIILAGLRQIAPDIPIVSEEAMSAGAQVDVSGGRFWLVDPLDGTKEFVNRNGEFTVNIGLIWDGAPRLGVLYAPVLDRMFAAVPDEASVEEKGAAPRPIHCRIPPERGLTVLSSRSHRNPEQFESFIRPFSVSEIRNSGSSLKFALIAAGEADLYPRFGPTMEWDIAAGHAILAAAGGCLSQPDGSALVYGKPGFTNPPFVAWGTERPALR